jgi:hypothetical protein
MTKSILLKCPACSVLNPTHVTKCVKCERPLFDVDRPAVPAGREWLAESKPELPAATRVSVTDVQMPFASMVTFMVKWALAAIPAMLILIFIGAVAVGFLRALAHG